MLEMLTGAVIFALGIVTGRYLPGRRGGNREVKPICSCGHAVSFHGDDGRCTAKQEVTRWARGRWDGMERETCTCQQYTGPQPLPSYYVPEITD